MVQGISLKRSQEKKPVKREITVERLESDINKDLKFEMRFGNSQIKTDYNPKADIKKASKPAQTQKSENEKAGSTLELGF